MNKNSPKNDRTEQFLLLLGEHSREIYAYILRLVIHRNDADDIFQETNLALWRKFDSFVPGTNFRAWAYRIAGNQVLAWRKNLSRDRLMFSADFLEAIARDTETDASPLNDRVLLFSECLQLLPERHRNLIALRYEKQLDVPTIARKKQKTIDAIYRALNRIRRSLYDCVKRRSENRR